MTNKASILHHSLPNGLTLIGEPNPLHKSTALGFFVKTGSRDEVGREAGVSHFLEHMMFKGTPTRSALDITYQLGNIGAQSNAFTSEENTVYYAVVVPQYFKEIQELLSDMLRPALDLEEFTTEKKVILEEIALYQDRPQFWFFEHALTDFFAAHPAGNSVLGSTDSISAVTRDEMADYFGRRYSPSNMTLVAAGNFNWERFVEDAERHCGTWKKSDTQRISPNFAYKPVQKEYRKPNINQAHLLYLTPSCSAQVPERYPLSLLSMILGDSSGSKMYWELIETGIAESASADNDEKDGTGCFLAYASMEPQSIDRVAGIMRKILDKPLDFTEDELERAKRKLCARIVLNGELPMGRLMSIGMEWTYRKTLNDLKETISLVQGVTSKDIEAALKKYPLQNWSEFRLMPQVN